MSHLSKYIIRMIALVCFAGIPFRAMMAMECLPQDECASAGRALPPSPNAAKRQSILTQIAQLQAALDEEIPAQIQQAEKALNHELSSTPAANQVHIKSLYRFGVFGDIKEYSFALVTKISWLQADLQKIPED